jgi:hypothetical protein
MAKRQRDLVTASLTSLDKGPGSLITLESKFGYRHQSKPDPQDKFSMGFVKSYKNGFSNSNTGCQQGNKPLSSTELMRLSECSSAGEFQAMINQHVNGKGEGMPAPEGNYARLKDSGLDFLRTRLDSSTEKKPKPIVIKLDRNPKSYYFYKDVWSPQGKGEKSPQESSLKGFGSGVQSLVKNSRPNCAKLMARSVQKRPYSSNHYLKSFIAGNFKGCKMAKAGENSIMSNLENLDARDRSLDPAIVKKSADCIDRGAYQKYRQSKDAKIIRKGPKDSLAHSWSVNNVLQINTLRQPKKNSCQNSKSKILVQDFHRFESERELFSPEKQSVVFENLTGEAGVIGYGSMDQRGSPAKNKKFRKTLNRLVQVEDHRSGACSTIKNFKIQKIEIEPGGPGNLDTRRGLLWSPGHKEYKLQGEPRI